jgi:hypothetical protein
MFIPLKKSSVNENQIFKGKIEFFSGEKEMWEVGREIFRESGFLKSWAIGPVQNRHEPIIYLQFSTCM